MAFRFTNRTGGASSGAFASLNLGTHVGDKLDDVLRNREIAAREVGPIQFMNQVHGNRVAIIEEVTNEIPTADALVTGIPGIPLAVQVADCIPLLLTSSQAVAAVHVGRKGLVNDVALKSLEVMHEIGAKKITAIIGPSICGTCYEVGEDIYQEVVALHPAAQSRTHTGTLALNLPAALRVLLESHGIDVDDQSICTVESHDHFSYRRDGVTGRQAGLVWL